MLCERALPTQFLGLPVNELPSAPSELCHTLQCLHFRAQRGRGRSRVEVVTIARNECGRQRFSRTSHPQVNGGQSSVMLIELTTPQVLYGSGADVPQKKSLASLVWGIC